MVIFVDRMKIILVFFKLFFVSQVFYSTYKLPISLYEHINKSLKTHALGLMQDSFHLARDAPPSI